MIRQIAALIAKELKIFRSDRRAVLIGIVTPIAIASFFGFLFSGAGREDVAKIPVLAVDEDKSAVSIAVVAGLGSDKLLEVKPADAATAREAVRHGKAAAAVILPKGLGDAAVRAFSGSAPAPEVTLLEDPSRTIEAGLVRGLLSEKIFREAARETFGGASGRRVLEESRDEIRKNPALAGPQGAELAALLDQVARWQDASQKSGAPAGGIGVTAPFTLREEALTAKTGVAYNSYAHSFAGMGIQFLLFIALDFGVALLLERQGGLWKRLRGAPISRGTLLAGKTIAGSLIGLFTIGSTFLFGILVFEIRIQGSVAGFLLLLAASALMASTFGLLLAALGRTPAATRGMSILAILALVMLGGGWVPAFVFPGWLQKASLVLPTRWAIDGLDAVTWRGAGFFEGALPAAAALLGYAALFLAVAWWRFRWNEE